MEPYKLVGKELTPELKAFRDAWLSSKAIHPAPAAAADNSAHLAIRLLHQ